MLSAVTNLTRIKSPNEAEKCAVFIVMVLPHSMITGADLLGEPPRASAFRSKSLRSESDAHQISERSRKMRCVYCYGVAAFHDYGGGLTWRTAEGKRIPIEELAIGI